MALLNVDDIRDQDTNDKQEPQYEGEQRLQLLDFLTALFLFPFPLDRLKLMFYILFVGRTKHRETMLLSLQAVVIENKHLMHFEGIGLISKLFKSLIQQQV